jgi:hypothetical protein
MTPLFWISEYTREETGKTNSTVSTRKVINAKETSVDIFILSLCAVLG